MSWDGLVTGMRRNSGLAVNVVMSVLASLTLAPPALAGTKVVASGEKLAITGDDGPNDVRIDYSEASNTWDVTIGGGIDSWDGCDHVSASRLSCPYTRIIDAWGTSDPGPEGMGAGDDSFRVGYGSDDVAPLPPGATPYDIVVDLGPGDDFFGGSEVKDVAFGQSGNDVLDGAEGNDWLSGGEDYPLAHPASPAPGSDQVFGGPGSDVIYDGDMTSNRGPDVLDGGGNPGDQDFVYYYVRTGSMTLDLADAGASQGESGEGDTVRDFERALTGDGADTVRGNAAVNTLYTGKGDDTIDVSGDPGNVDVVYCSLGFDRVSVDASDVANFEGGCEPSPPVAPPRPPPPPAASPSVPPPRPVQPPRTPRRTGDALISSVAQQVAQAVSALRRCGTTGLLKTGGCRDTFTALRPGTVLYRVSVPATAARAAAGTVIASGRKAIRAAGDHPVKVKATKKGRRLLRRARKLRARLTVTFKDSSGDTAKRAKAVVIRRLG